MQNRSLKLRLAELLQVKRPNVKLTSVAEELGISDTTLRKYMKNEALSFERRVLERICDCLDVSISELVQLVPCEFFPAGNELLLLRTPRQQSGTEDFHIFGRLHSFFSEKNGIRLREEFCSDHAAIADLVRSRDCLIVGSPRSNAAGEAALCALFDADPLDSGRENRAKLPLLMRVPQEWHSVSAIIENLPPVKQYPANSTLDIAESAEQLAPKTPRATAHYYKAETFDNAEVQNGRDFGVVFVADHPSKDGASRIRTYWVSGFTSMGTSAATAAIETELRGFSIDKPGTFVLAAIQANFTKSGSGQRRLLGYDVVHTIRGTLPGLSSAAPPQEPLHNARWEKFRIVVRKSWRKDLGDDAPALRDFYDHELAALSEQAFAGTLGRLEARHANIPADRRQPLDRYLDEVRKARDEGDGLFGGE